MTRLPFSGSGSLVLLALSVCVSSCAVSSTEFVERIRGYSVTRGRIVEIDNLHAHEFKALSDGLAMTVADDGCEVTMKFREDADETKIFEIGEGVILVHGYSGDYILESRSGEDMEFAEPLIP